MTQSKHTPGPWDTFDDGADIIGICRHAQNSPHNDGRDTKIIANVEYQGEGQGHISNQEREANAHLIAAAPELLEALEEVIDWVPELDPYTDQDNSKVIHRAHKAIAKARGE